MEGKERVVGELNHPKVTIGNYKGQVINEYVQLRWDEDDAKSDLYKFKSSAYIMKFVDPKYQILVEADAEDIYV